MRKLILGDFDTLNKYYGFVDDEGQKCFLTCVNCGHNPTYSIITDDFMVFAGAFYRNETRERVMNLVDEEIIEQIYEFDSSGELLKWLNNE